ncbi:MAG TPA: hypothetical protein VMV07_04255 [Streptosporangiaceae bacterium]|nr:hypothetical protein [Streptosporangiaceae bacterium]
MTILLALAVAAVAVASSFMAVRFRSNIRQNATLLAQVREQMAAQCTEQVQQAERRLSVQNDQERRVWSDALNAVRQDAQGRVSRLGEQTRQNRDRLGEDGRMTGQLRSDLQAEAQERQTAIHQLRADLQSETQERQHALQQLRDSLRSEMISQVSDGTQRATERVEQQLAEAAREINARATQAQAALAAIQGELADHRQRADRQLADVASDIAFIDQRLGDVRRHVRRRLDYEVLAGGAARRVLAGGICTGQAAAADILPLLYEDFCHAVPLEIVFREPRNRTDERFYLFWRSLTGAAAERQLGTLLTACPDGGAPSQPGLNELRSLLLALHRAGPATLQVGPMIVSRTQGGLVGGIVTAAAANRSTSQRPDASTAEQAELLAHLEAGQLTDLASWADSYAS